MTQEEFLKLKDKCSKLIRENADLQRENKRLQDQAKTLYATLSNHVKNHHRLSLIWIPPAVRYRNATMDVVQIKIQQGEWELQQPKRDAECEWLHKRTF